MLVVRVGSPVHVVITVVGLRDRRRLDETEWDELERPSSDTVGSPASAAIRSALRMECHAKNPATNVMMPPPHSAMRTPGIAYSYGPIDTDWSLPMIAWVTQSQKSAHSGEMVSEIRRQSRTTV